jgi:hypothetical protein
VQDDAISPIDRNEVEVQGSRVVRAIEKALTAARLNDPKTARRWLRHAMLLLRNC